MNVAKALKKFFYKLTGVEPSGNTVSEVIRNGTANVGATKSELILASSTENSTKKFKITVDDTGAVTATEVSD